MATFFLKGPFSLSDSSKPRIFSQIAEIFLQIPSLNKVYRDAQAEESTESFYSKTLKAMQVSLDFNREALENIPKVGATIVVANHASGGLDGVVLGSLLLSIRPDVKIIANGFLEKIPEFHDSMIFVDPFETREAARANLKPMREIFEHLQSGGLIAIFPAGGVSKLDLKEQRIRDPEWKLTLARLVRKTSAAVVPIYFHDHTGALFQMAKLLPDQIPFHDRIPLALIPHEILKRRKSTIRLTIGRLISNEKLKAIESDESLVALLRSRTYLLANSAASRKIYDEIKDEMPFAEAEAVAAAIEPALLELELSRLPSESLLRETTDYQVYMAKVSEIPNCIYEIGRLRELTFRQVGEGSGRALDLDRYDDDYLHVFVWNKRTRKITGSYRMGLIDQLILKRGEKGVYTRSLFNYRNGLLEKLGTALELGRAFVIDEEQGGHTLQLIWQGIGGWIAKHPEYCQIIGSVSISDEFEASSKQLILEFLKRSLYDADLGEHIKPREKPKFNALTKPELNEILSGISGIADLSEIVSQIEKDGKSAPELFEHYTKLNAKFLSFNIDRDFHDAIDCLIMVDLRRSDFRLLRRFLGKDGIESFKSFHQV